MREELKWVPNEASANYYKSKLAQIKAKSNGIQRSVSLNPEAKPFNGGFKRQMSSDVASSKPFDEGPIRLAANVRGSKIYMSGTDGKLLKEAKALLEAFFGPDLDLEEAPKPKPKRENAKSKSNVVEVPINKTPIKSYDRQTLMDLSQSPLSQESPEWLKDKVKEMPDIDRFGKDGQEPSFHHLAFDWEAVFGGHRGSAGVIGRKYNS